MAPAEKRAPTIRDVAREAGVSKSLVSLVFSDAEHVSEERRLRVLEAAERLGYRPNVIAQLLSTGHQNVVAILVSNFSNPIFAEIVGAAKAQFTEAGQRTLIVTAQVEGVDGEPVLDRDNLELLRDLKPGRLLTVGTIPEFAELAELTATVPTVVASAIDATADTVASVRSDDYAGIELLIEHLAERGARRPVFVGGDGGTVSAARAHAFREVCAKRGFADARVERSDLTEAGGQAAAARILATGAVPDAIVAVNDLAALGVIGELESAGVLVPGDCLVTGYDDSAFAKIPRVSLTTIDPQNKRIGREAAEALLAESEPFAGGREVLIAPRLVVRGSSTR